MKKKAIEQTLVRASALTVGAATSRVVADKLPIKNKHLKRGALVLSGLLGAAFIERDSTSKAFVQDMAEGVVATQAAYWIKDVIGEKMKENHLITTALGNPVGNYNNPVQFRMGYANVNQEMDTIDTSYQDVTFEM